MHKHFFGQKYIVVCIIKSQIFFVVFKIKINGINFNTTETLYIYRLTILYIHLDLDYV